jgi:hypothetical protein
MDRLRRISPDAAHSGDQLIVPGPASERPAIIDLVRASGASILGLTADEGRLDVFYRDLVGGRS